MIDKYKKYNITIGNGYMIVTKFTSIFGSFSVNYFDRNEICYPVLVNIIRLYIK